MLHGTDSLQYEDFGRFKSMEYFDKRETKMNYRNISTMTPIDENDIEEKSVKVKYLNELLSKESLAYGLRSKCRKGEKEPERKKRKSISKPSSKTSD